MRLGVNIDHIATLRQQRREEFPEPVYAALVAQEHGADSIVAHLREDRRHIQDRDIRLLKQTLKIPLAMEMAVTVDRMNHETQQLCNPKSRFVLLQDPQMWLEFDLRDFFHYARELIQSQSTLAEIADFLGMDEPVAASHLGKLRALGVIDVAPDVRPSPRTTRVPLPVAKAA